VKKTWKIGGREGTTHVVKAEINGMTGRRTIRVDDELVVKKAGISGSKHLIDVGGQPVVVYFSDGWWIGSDLQLDCKGRFVPDVRGRVSSKTPAALSKRMQGPMPAILAAAFASVGVPIVRRIEGVEPREVFLIGVVLAMLGAWIGTGLSRLTRKSK
jgi:hypothetical protein